MAGVIISDGNDDAHVQCPEHKSRPSVALLEHSEEAALGTIPMHRQKQPKVSNTYQSSYRNANNSSHIQSQ
jgi:hypothetical protein